MYKLTSNQIKRALLWTGSLTDACEILDMPFHRAWNYVSGKPISVRPVLTGPRAKLLGRSRSKIHKNGYSFAELLKFRFAETLLSARVPGETVELLIDGRLASELLKTPGSGSFDATVLILYRNLEGPVVMAFPPGTENDFQIAFDAARKTDAARCVLSVGSVMQEVMRRTVWRQEHREYSAKSPGSMVKEALSRSHREKSEPKTHRAELLDH
jgi:hypothetical protein